MRNISLGFVFLSLVLSMHTRNYLKHYFFQYVVKLTYYMIFIPLLHQFYNIIIGLGLNNMTFLARVQRLHYC